MKNLTPIFTLGLGLAVAPAWALPDPRADLTELTKNVSLKDIGPVMGDHEKKNVVYVMPSDMKVVGQFFQTSMGMDCTDLYNQHKLVNGQPSNTQAQTLVDKNQFYSLSFEVLAESIRSSKIQSEIDQLQNEAAEAYRQNKELHEEYSGAYQEVEGLKQQYTQLNTQLEGERTKLMAELALAATEAERATIRANYYHGVSLIKAEMTEITKLQTAANTRFANATKAWAPIRDELDFLEKLKTAKRQNLEEHQLRAKQLFEEGDALLDLKNKKIIGKATAGYSLSANKKVELLSERIKEAGLDFDVRHLDVFNVTINPSITKLEYEIKTDGVPTYHLNSYQIDAATQVALGVGTKTLTMPAQVEQEGEEARDIAFEVKAFNPNVGSAQNFEMPITLGGYCGQATLAEKTYTLRDRQGRKVTTTVTYPEFNKNLSRVLYAQNVSLNFNYYQKAEPIEGKCELNIDQSSTYVRNSGKKKSGGFWRRRTKSWDHTRHDYNKDMGLSCSLTKSPVGSNPEESALINEALEKSLYQDLFHMFIMSYAKEYSIIEVPHTELGQDSRFFSQVGGGVMNLCGKNKFCEFGSVVLKSLDDLVGSRHTGSTSHTQTSKGKIKKDFKLSTYLVNQGAANVEMKVCLERQACEETL